MGGFGDQMFMSDASKVKLNCAHNHPEQGEEPFCKLCGADLSAATKQGVSENGRPQSQD